MLSTIVPVSASVSVNFDAKFDSNFQAICKQISLPESLADGDRYLASGTSAAPYRDHPTNRPGAAPARSWSLPVVDGAVAAVPVWASKKAWLALVRRVLGSSRADRMRGGKISLDLVMAIAEADAATADHLTGRNVTTSHQTVAERLSISSRHVGTGRRLLEQLNLARTIVMGRWLSPEERTAARALHGGKQLVAASVRVLTMPSPDFLATTFHLPRSGKVNLSSSIVKRSPTRAHARAKAAARPKLKKTPTNPVPEAPRDPAWQRFAWQVAQKFDLLATPLRQSSRNMPALRSHRGSLAGNRHIGHLLLQLQRYGVTPRRFTAASLHTDLQRLLDARNYRPPASGEIRDRFTHFVWKLTLLHDAALTETELERQHRASADWISRAHETQRHVEASAADRATNLIETAHAAEAALKRRLTTPTGASRAEWQKAVVRGALGATALHQASPETQLRVGDVFTLDRELTATGWRRAHTATSTTWTNPEEQEITLTHTNLTITKPPLPQSLEMHASKLACKFESKE